MQNLQGSNLQRRKNTKYTFAPANRFDSAPLSSTQPIVEEIIKGKDRKKKVTCITVFFQCWSSLGKHLKNTSQKVMITGLKKVCKDKAFWGLSLYFFARNPKILSSTQVGKRMEWWIIPKGNPMEAAATGDGMYRRA